jgi:hypothetical protein
MTGFRIANKALMCKLAKPTIYPELGLNLYIKRFPLDFDDGIFFFFGFCFFIV